MTKDKNQFNYPTIKYSYGYAQNLYEPFKQKEAKYDWRLKDDYFYIIRFDGKGMTKGFKAKPKAINKLFFETMKDTFYDFYEFCASNQTILFGYSFSDEISILIRKSNSDKDDDDNRIEKLLSLLPSKLALIFYRNAHKHHLNLHNQDWIFDARIIQLKEEKVPIYFLARQAYAIDRYIMMLKTEYGIDYNIKTSKEVLSRLKEKGISYKSLPRQYRYGLNYSPTNETPPFEFAADKLLLQKLCFDK